MKTLRLLLPFFSGLAMAAPGFHLAMPDTGVMPSHIRAEFTTSMGERHGGSDLAWSSYCVTVPFLDPRKSTLGDWNVDAHLDVHATLLSTGGDLDLRRNELYTATLPISLLHSTPKKELFIAGVAPTVSTDFAGTSHYFDLSASVLYANKLGKDFSYTIGAIVSPRYFAYSVMPIIGFRWHVSPEWDISLARFKLTAMYKCSERLRLGPFAAIRGGGWMVDTPVGDRLFRINSLAIGVTGEYDFHGEGERKRIIYASVGSTVATTAGFYERNFKKDTIELHHYKPGLFICTGVDFRF